MMASAIAVPAQSSTDKTLTTSTFLFEGYVTGSDIKLIAEPHQLLSTTAVTNELSASESLRLPVIPFIYEYPGNTCKIIAPIFFVEPVEDRASG
jgi:hypothetical protein